MAMDRHETLAMTVKQMVVKVRHETLAMTMIEVFVKARQPMADVAVQFNDKSTQDKPPTTLPDDSIT